MEEPVDSVKAFVTSICAEVKADKKHHEKAFKEMKDNMRFAREGATKEWIAADKYTVNIVQRHLQQRKSSLYAKNPKASAKRKQKLDFAVWDETPESLQEAMIDITASGQAGMDPQPQSMAIYEDYQQGMARRRQIDKIGKTMELCYHHALDEQVPRFKTSAKRLVTRTLTCGVGYTKLGFDRAMEHSPDRVNQMEDISARLAKIQRLTDEMGEGELDDDSAGFEELQQSLARLQEEKDLLVNEGLAFDFPRSTAIIPDRNCISLYGWLGAGRVTQEFLFTPDKVKELYGVDITSKYLRYQENGKRAAVRTDTDKELACVWEVYDRTSGNVFTVCDGYSDYLEPPRAPVIQVEQFFPFWALLFNDLESDEDLFPHSDVYYIRHPQKEINRSGEGLREHRHANRPRYVAPKGVLDEDDTAAVESIGPHQVAFVGTPPGVKIDEIIQRVPVAGIDPALYSTAPAFEDVLRSVGSQEANIGGTAGATATESSIAESSRMSTQSSNVDDLDDFLTDLARASGQVMLHEYSLETVQEIAGPGAVWPELSPQEIADELHLEIKAGSSGRPNKAQELANFERAAPYVMQIPGIRPEWLAAHVINILDDGIDLTDAIASGIPSITAMNSMIQPGTGDAETSPEQQGGEGANNSPEPSRGNEGPQPGMPTGA